MSPLSEVRTALFGSAARCASQSEGGQGYTMINYGEEEKTSEFLFCIWGETQIAEKDWGKEGWAAEPLGTL